MGDLCPHQLGSWAAEFSLWWGLTDKSPLTAAHPRQPSVMEGMWWQLGWGSQDRNTQDTESGQEAPSGKEKPGREVARKGNQHKMTQPAVLWDAVCTARENKFL